MKNERGYALAVLMVMTTVLLVALTSAEISWQKVMQREREEELIFRGKQFMRGIMLWKNKFPGPPNNPMYGPTTIDALLSTNNLRFLRKRWKDPITNSDQWRIIRIPLAGGLPGSRGIPGLDSSSRSSQTSDPPGTAAFGGSGASTLPGAGPLTSSTSGMTSGSPVMLAIVGVASTSENQSLKIFNGRNKYNQWEFVYLQGLAIKWSIGPGSVSGGPSMPSGNTPLNLNNRGSGLSRPK
jgi:hypothetical protein